MSLRRRFFGRLRRRSVRVDPAGAGRWLVPPGRRQRAHEARQAAQRHRPRPAPRQPRLRCRHRLHRQERGRLPRGVDRLPRRARRGPLHRLRQRQHGRQCRPPGALPEPRSRDAHRLAPGRWPAGGLQPRPALLRRASAAGWPTTTWTSTSCPLVDDDIPTFLARFPDVAVVRVPRLRVRLLGPSQAPPGLAIDDYTQVANVLDLDADLPPRVKSIVRPEAISAVDIHLAFPADVPAPGRAHRDRGGGRARPGPAEPLLHALLRGVRGQAHRGSATGRIDRPAVPFDLPTIETNTAARRFSARTQATLAHLRSLEPRPYTYGSQLRLEWFPRPNDLGRFAEFALANLAAGLAQPARSAALRLRNLHEGIGLVADLAGDRLPSDARGALRFGAPRGAHRAHARPTRGEPGGWAGRRLGHARPGPGRGRVVAGAAARRHAALLVGRLPAGSLGTASAGAGHRARGRHDEPARHAWRCRPPTRWRGSSRWSRCPAEPHACVSASRASRHGSSATTSSPSPPAEVHAWA